MRLHGSHLGSERRAFYTKEQLRELGRAWQNEVLSRLNPEDVYGPWLTGVELNDGSLQCRDPESPTGDRDPSAYVTTNDTERFKPCRYYSHRTGSWMSPFDFMEKYHDDVSDFYEAKKKAARLSGVPLPTPLLRKHDRDSQSEYDKWDRH